MKLLLDTHIWLWLLSEPAKLGPRVFQELKSAENELWISPISTWEVLTLNFKRRIQLEVEPREWLSRATAGTREAPLTHEIACVARELPLHQDPADRIIAATAKVLNLTIVTADARLLGLPNILSLANR